MSTEMIDRVELTPFGPAPLERSSGNFWLIETLRRWGVTAYAGVKRWRPDSRGQAPRTLL